MMPHTSKRTRQFFTHTRLRPDWERLSAWYLTPWRTRRAAVVLALCLGIVALMASAVPTTASAHGSHAPRKSQVSHKSPVSHKSQVSHVSQAKAGNGTTARHLLIARSDLHVDGLPNASELEVDLTISQTQSDCQVPLHGQICLRYNILLDDTPVQSGYGLISPGKVTVSGSSITLRTDTRHEPLVTRTAGSGGLISVTWTTVSGLPQPGAGTAALTVATVQGSIIGYTIPSTNVTAGVLMYGGA